MQSTAISNEQDDDIEEDDCEVWLPGASSTDDVEQGDTVDVVEEGGRGEEEIENVLREVNADERIINATEEVVSSLEKLSIREIPKLKSRIIYKLTPDSEWTRGTIHSRAGKADKKGTGRKYDGCLNVLNEDSGEIE